MKSTTIAGFLCLLVAGLLIAAIYGFGGRLSRDELYAVAILVGAGLMLLDPGDMKELFGKAIDKLSWNRGGA